jgi:hypothetical protein
MPALVLPERPETSANSIEEIMAAAHALECAAAYRYQQLGSAMRTVGRVFELPARMEPNPPPGSRTRIYDSGSVGGTYQVNSNAKH